MNSTVSICVIKNFRTDLQETKYSDGKGKKYQSGYGSKTKETTPGSFFQTSGRTTGFLTISRFWVVSFKSFVPLEFKYSLYSRE